MLCHFFFLLTSEYNKIRYFILHPEILKLSIKFIDAVKLLPGHVTSAKNVKM